MKRNLGYSLIFVLIFIIALLGILLFDSQNKIKQQKLVIGEQSQKITQLESEVEKLSVATPENIIKMTKGLIKEKGLDFIKDKILSK